MIRYRIKQKVNSFDDTVIYCAQRRKPGQWFWHKLTIGGNLYADYYWHNDREVILQVIAQDRHRERVKQQQLRHHPRLEYIGDC